MTARRPQFPGEHLFPEGMQVGMPYRGDDSTGDLDGMDFTLERIDGPHHDMADDESPFYVIDVTIGAETWTDLIVPADATVQLLAPDDDGADQ